MKRVNISSDFFGKYKTDKELFELVKKWVKANLVDLVINLPLYHGNKAVCLTWQGLKNDLNKVHPPYDKKLISFARLDDIIKNSQFIIKETDKSNKPDIKAVYKFFGSVTIDNESFDVIIIIKETSKTFLYDHILLLKE